jgi:hypothetical protein
LALRANSSRPGAGRALQNSSRADGAQRCARPTLRVGSGAPDSPASRTHRERDRPAARTGVKTMFDKATFEIIGRVGQIKTGNGVVRVSIATNASFKKNGEWQDRTIWNEVSVFDESARNYVAKTFIKGDYVRAAGTIRQNSYEKDGEHRYTTDLAVVEISRAPSKKPEAESA